MSAWTLLLLRWNNDVSLAPITMEGFPTTMHCQRSGMERVKEMETVTWHARACCIEIPHMPPTPEKAPPP